MTTVRDVHPYVLREVREVTGRNRGRLVLAECSPRPGDDEDIDALPVVEQAAILCSIFASDIDDDLTWDDVEDAIDLAAIVDVVELAHYDGTDVHADTMAMLRHFPS